MNSADNFAVICSGGKQYKVTEGSVFDVEKLNVEAESSIVLDKILLVQCNGTTHIGTPYVVGATVRATVQGNYRDKKVHILKFKRRKHQLKRQGHRQTYTTLEINSIDYLEQQSQ